MNKGFVTIATGKESYYRIAYNLLLSYRLFSDNPLPFAIICDKENQYTRFFDQVILLKNPKCSYIDKLCFPEYTPFDETIFLDADCMAYRDLNDFWVYFSEGSFFSSFGLNQPLDYKHGWFKPQDIGEFGERIKSIPEFIGGIYYVRKDLELINFMNTVHYIHSHYYDYKFRQFTDPADETIFALAMAVHDQTTVGPISPDICFYPAKSYFEANIQTQSLIYGHTFQPTKGLISNGYMVHWGSSFINQPYYKIEEYRLHKLAKGKTISKYLDSLVFDYYKLAYFVERGKRKIKKIINNK